MSPAPSPRPSRQKQTGSGDEAGQSGQRYPKPLADELKSIARGPISAQADSRPEAGRRSAVMFKIDEEARGVERAFSCRSRRSQGQQLAPPDAKPPGYRKNPGRAAPAKTVRYQPVRKPISPMRTKQFVRPDRRPVLCLAGHGRQAGVFGPVAEAVVPTTR